MVFDFGSRPPRTPSPTRRERIVHRVVRLADVSRKGGRRVRNVFRRATTSVLTRIDYLLLGVKWQLLAPRTEVPRNNVGVILDPICFLSLLERHVLESCQLVCKLWHRTIEENHAQLALRKLDYFWLNREKRNEQEWIEYPSFRRYQLITVECNMREIISVAAKSGQCVSTEKLDDKVMRLCQWGALRLLRNAYVDELKLDGRLFVFSPLTAIKAALGRATSLSVGTLILRKLPLRTPAICWFLRDCRALFEYDNLRFDDWRPRNYNKVVSAVTCSAMTFYCPVVSVTYLAELLKRAKCSSLKIVDSRIKVNVSDLIQAIRSLHPSQIPQQFYLATYGNFDFISQEFDPSFDLLKVKASAVSMTPVKDEEDARGQYMHYHYRFPADIEGLVLEATIGLRTDYGVFVRTFQYRFLRDESTVRRRLSVGHQTQFRMPTEIFVDILASLIRKDVDSCQLVSAALNGRIMALSGELPLHPLEYFKMNIENSRTFNLAAYSLAFSYHFDDSCVRDVRIFDGLENTDEPRSTDKIRLAFAHFRNTYIREAFPKAPTTKFFCRYFDEDFNANIGSVHLNWRDQCEIALRFRSVNHAVGNTTLVLALIERFQLLEDTSKVPSSFTLHTDVFGVSEVFKGPVDDVQVTVEPAFASDEPSSSTASCTCHRRRIRNMQTKDVLEVCLIRPSNRCGVKTVTFSLVRNPCPM